jgi:hypothetical protein
MASNKTNKITVGDNDYDIPQWASEETLSKLSELTATSHVMFDVISKKLSNSNISASQLQSDLENIAGQYAESTDDVSDAKKKSLDKKILGAAKATKATIDKFSNTDAPLSSMVDMTSELGSALLGAGKGMASKKAQDGNYAASLGKAIPIVGALGAGAMALAGFQAAQFEQFAKAQETMINSGAIMFGGEEPYENLKQQAIKSGLSYTELSAIVSKHGIGLQSLGKGVSSGTSVFASMLKSVNKTGDQFGDYGLRSAEMAEVLADYVNIQRLTISKDMALASTQDGVEAGFHNLMIETTALASLTGENRSELLQKRMAALAQPQVAAALQIMDKAGGGQADVARSFIAQLALLETSMGPLGKEISDKFNDYIFRVAPDPQNFDMTHAVGEPLSAALEQANNGVIERINAVFRSGDVDTAQNMLVKAIAEMRNAELGSSNVVAGSMQDYVHQLAVAGNKVHLQMDKMIGMSKSEQAAYLREIAEKSKESGQMTTAMNDMKVSFMGVQDAFTVNIKSGTAMAQALASGLKAGANTIRGLLGLESNDDNADFNEKGWTSYIDASKKANYGGGEGGVGKGHGANYNYDNPNPDPTNTTDQQLSPISALGEMVKSFFGGEELRKQEEREKEKERLFGIMLDEAKKEAINLMERERFWAEKELHFADPANKDIPFVQKHRSQDETTHGWYDTPADEIDDNAPNAHLEQVWATYSPKEMRAQREGESDRMYERLNERFNNKEDTREKTLLKAAKQFAHDLAGTVNPKKFRTSTTYSLAEGTHINMTPTARKFGGPVIKNKSYLVGEDGQEIYTPTGDGNITNANKTSLMLDSANNGDDDMSKHLEDIVAMKTQTVAVLKQMKAAMKSINRSKDYKRAVDNLA